MKPLIYLQPNKCLKTTSEVVRYLREETGDYEDTYKSVLAGEFEIYTVPFDGFLMISVLLQQGKRVLYIDAARGKNIFNRRVLESVCMLATKKRCDFVQCHTYKNGIERLLKKLGFSAMKNEPYLWEYQHA